MSKKVKQLAKLCIVVIFGVCISYPAQALITIQQKDSTAIQFRVITPLDKVLTPLTWKVCFKRQRLVTNFWDVIMNTFRFPKCRYRYFRSGPFNFNVSRLRPRQYYQFKFSYRQGRTPYQHHQTLYSRTK